MREEVLATAGLCPLRCLEATESEEITDKPATPEASLEVKWQNESRGQVRAGGFSRTYQPLGCATQIWRLADIAEGLETRDSSLVAKVVSQESLGNM